MKINTPSIGRVVRFPTFSLKIMINKSKGCGVGLTPDTPQLAP